MTPDQKCAERLNWLGRPPLGHRWHVLQLRWWLFKAVLMNESNEYVSLEIPSSAGKFEWLALAREMIYDFDRYKQRDITADELVRSIETAELAEWSDINPEGMLR